jgi:hypothetical protein
MISQSNYKYIYTLVYASLEVIQFRDRFAIVGNVSAGPIPDWI